MLPLSLVVAPKARCCATHSHFAMVVWVSGGDGGPAKQNSEISLLIGSFLKEIFTICIIIGMIGVSRRKGLNVTVRKKYVIVHKLS